MVKRLIVLGALLLLVLPSVASTQAATLDGKKRPGTRTGAVAGSRGGPGTHPVLVSHSITGTLATISDAALTVSANGVSYTINLSSTTKIVRRYNGESSVDELSPGDQVAVVSPQVANHVISGTTAISATLVKDMSIQEAWTRMLGTIQTVSGSTVPATVTVTVVRDRRNAPFTVGQSLPLAISTSTKVLSPTVGALTVMTGTAGLPILSAATGTTVTVMGVYNKQLKAFTTVFRVRLVRRHTSSGSGSAGSGSGSGSTGSGSGSTGSGSGSTGSGSGSTGSGSGSTGTGGVPSGQAVTLGGSLVGVSGITAPATLTVQTSKFGLVTINVGTSPVVQIVRRFNGQSGLDELSPGDELALQGTFTDSTDKTLNVTSIKDLSIQEALTRAILQVTQTSATGFVGTVMADNPAFQHPFSVGQTLTVTVDSSTKVLVPATAPAVGETSGSLSSIATNQTVTVLGVYNRKQNTFISATLVRIHR